MNIEKLNEKMDKLRTILFIIVDLIFLIFSFIHFLAGSIFVKILFIFIQLFFIGDIFKLINNQNGIIIRKISLICACIIALIYYFVF